MKPANIKPTVNSIELPNRVKLQYVERGDCAGTPVLFLHGITDSWHSFEPVLPHLPASIRAFALSQRGHGDSDKPTSGYYPRDFADDVLAFMDALKLKQAVIAGHSMGSNIAQRFALDYPERILGLALIASFFSFRGKQCVMELRDSVSNLADPIDRDFALEFQQSTLAKEVPQTFLETVVEESRKTPARVWRATLEGLLEADHSAELYKIKTPTLIVWGDQDAYCPRSDQEALREAITGSRLLAYTSAGHAVHWEYPERFAADVAAFTHSLASRAQAK
ncbi:MAG TPA: alpha/beta hydrolase [Blastocatellia bacterium]|nr:alpha/beta hydrolase [Blastocatellia bacterium]